MNNRRSTPNRFKYSQAGNALNTKAADNRRLVSSIEYPVSSIQHRASSIEYPITPNSQPATRNPQPTTRTQLLCIVLIFLMSALSGFSADASVSNQDGDAFKAVIQKLSSLADRSTGTADNKAAADYIKAELSQLGFEIVDSQQFATPVKQYGTSSLSIPDRGITIPIRPINSNAISPQKIAAPGLNGPLIYVGQRRT